MKKIALVLACIALPLAALAAKPEADAKAGRPAAAASAAAARHEHIKPAVPAASDAHGNVRASKERGSLMGACRQEATDRGLSGTAYRAAIADCMNKPAN